MKKIFFIIYTLITGILVVSCAATKNRSANSQAAIKAKIDSRDYVIDIKWNSYSDSEIILFEQGYIHICGDTITSRMNYDYDKKYDLIPPKHLEDLIIPVNYKIIDYKKTEWCRNRTEISFSFVVYYKSLKETHPVHYLLKIGPSQGVRVYIDGIFHSGSLRL